MSWPSGGEIGDLITKTETGQQWTNPEQAIPGYSDALGDIAALDADIQQTQSEVTGLTVDVENLEERVTTLEGKSSPEILVVKGSFTQINESGCYFQLDDYFPELTLSDKSTASGFVKFQSGSDTYVLPIVLFPEISDGNVTGFDASISGTVYAYVSGYGNRIFFVNSIVVNSPLYPGGIRGNIQWDVSCLYLDGNYVRYETSLNPAFMAGTNEFSITITV